MILSIEIGMQANQKALETIGVMWYNLFIFFARGVKMKKILSLIIASALLLTACAPANNAFSQETTEALTEAVAAAGEENALNFAVASDLHYVCPTDELDNDIDHEIYWYANRRAAMENESSFIIDEFLNQCAEDETCEFILIPGDIVNDGKVIIQQHIDMAAKFKAFEEETGKPIYVIPGNHDYGVDCEVELDDFLSLYHDFGYAEALTVNGASYTVDLNDEYRLIALDSTDPSKSTEDGLTNDKVEWVKEQTEKAKADGKHPILMMHHNLLDHLPLQRLLSHDFIVRKHYTTATKFADWGIKLVFTGHEHCSDGATFTTPSGNVIYDFATTSLTMYPLQYRSFSITAEEINYSVRTIEKIDTDALLAATPGLTQEHVDLMNAGMNDYAKGYLKAGVEYRLERSLSMNQIGIEEGQPFYNLVNTAVSGLLKVLNDPLYGEGSIQELAAEYNLEIPDSSYENGWDVATELVGAHYAGSENYELEGTEVTIFLRLVALVLRDDLANVADETLLLLANMLLQHFGTDGIAVGLTKLGTEVFGAVTPIEYLLLAAVSPLLYDFTEDHDGVDDNNGTLPGYGTVTPESKAENVINAIRSFFETFIYNIKTIFKILYKIF